MTIISTFLKKEAILYNKWVTEINNPVNELLKYLVYNLYN
ncbi:unnamed protein product [marine sediment metagenome]|uniref:Uncharacterized protein n=1 Tax=marine sediment metagenome TaxID=412755 RepID=X1CTZ3_9ZZZZ